MGGLIAVGASCILPEYGVMPESSASGGGGAAATGGEAGEGGALGSGASGGQGQGGVPALPLGAACEEHPDCESALCVDGVCCGEPCTKRCYTCSSAKGSTADGQCEPVPDGEDPDDECEDFCLMTSLAQMGCIDTQCELVVAVPDSPKCGGGGS